MSRRVDVCDFYEVLSSLEQRLGGPRPLSSCHGRMEWPRCGVYFFLDRAEPRTTSGSGPRVVRVGTHGLTATSKATLWRRLSQHRGTARTGAGNHRSSIFRLLVGECLIRSGLGPMPTWAVGDSAGRAGRLHKLDAGTILARERELEAAVSRYIGDLSVVWLPMADTEESRRERAYLECNAIALLSNFERTEIDNPSATWLAHHSQRERVRRSGLWNNQHVEKTHHTGFLRELRRLAGAR